MLIPAIPPSIQNISVTDFSQRHNFFEIFSPTDNKGRYLHWDKLRHLIPPNGFTSEEWWAAIKFSRMSLKKILPFRDKQDHHFYYCTTDFLQEKQSWLDRGAAGTITTDSPITNKETQQTYMINSLIDEAISSSQLEGAATTHKVAKEMIRERREPESHDEKMILNNYRGMEFIKEIRSEELTPSMIKQIHKELTKDTLENRKFEGAFRTNNDIRVVGKVDHETIHVPPPFNELEDRISTLCLFANGELDRGFIHPVMRAIILHFVLAYDHPFEDGNGRTARALFYWSMLNQGYWLIEYISISNIIKRAPVQYTKAYLHTETDENDLTYFIIHQLMVIEKAMAELQQYLERKTNDIHEAQDLLSGKERLRKGLNFRQLNLLRHALRHPNTLYSIEAHKNTHGVSYDTARRDLVAMAGKFKLFDRVKSGAFSYFVSPADLKERIKKI
ncbi:MAG: Fic family protein [Desulfobacteraceae bacterium]|nr:Fic family protein [Desulfobacteraceae bacterium]